MTFALQLQHAENGFRAIILEDANGTRSVAEVAENRTLAGLQTWFKEGRRSQKVTHVCVDLCGNWEEPDCLTVWEAAESSMPWKLMPPAPGRVVDALLKGQFREMKGGESFGWSGAAKGARVWDAGVIQLCASYFPGEGLRVDAASEDRQWTYDLTRGTVEEL